MKLSYFPQIKVIHTSRIFHGQLYVPVANWLLMIGTILVASIYNNVCRQSAELIASDTDFAYRLHLLEMRMESALCS
jgi:K+ transporter